MSVCPIHPDDLYIAMLIAVALFSFYLMSRDQPNPYDKRNLLADAKAGNKWARANLAYAVIFGCFMLGFGFCL